MSITRQKKEEILKNLKENIKNSQAMVFLNFHGLDVAVASQLRKKLRDFGAKYEVIKKTLIKKALGEEKISGEIPFLEGEIGMVFSAKEPIAPLKELKAFSKKKGVKILGAVFENRFISAETALELADIPSREILLGKLVNVINSPIQGIASALNGINKSFVVVLDQIKNSRS